MNWVQSSNGCVLCGSWTGQHQNHNCPTGFDNCKEPGCGKAHMHQLHGSNNKFAGMVHVSNQVNQSKPKSKNKSKPSAMTLNYRGDPEHRVGARVDVPGPATPSVGGPKAKARSKAAKTPGQGARGGCPGSTTVSGPEFSKAGPAPTNQDVDQENKQVTLYQMERILLAPGFCIPTVLAMYDTGANVNIVVTSLAERLGLKGRAVQQTITTAGGERTVHVTKQYWLPLQKRSGEVCKVLCIGMDRITEDVGMVDVAEAAELFGLDKVDVYRPQGQVDLILGVHEAAIFPVHKALRGNLQLLGSCFGSGLLLAGTHPCLKLIGQSQGAAPLHFRKKGSSTVTKIKKNSRKFAKVNLVHSECECLITRAESSFFESEELGLSQPARCGTCKDCSKCSVRARQMSRKEQAELAVIESSIVFNKDEAKVTFEYPYLYKDVSKLGNNIGQVIKIEESVEKGLVKSGRKEEYDRELRGYLGRGAFKELSKEEIEAWRIKGGAVNYISHHGVLKESQPNHKIKNRVKFQSGQ